MDRAVLSLIVTAHKAEQLASIYHAAGEDDAAREQREIAEDCRHGIEILEARFADWLAGVNAAAEERGHRGTLATTRELRDLYRDGLEPPDAFEAWLEDQPGTEGEEPS